MTAYTPDPACVCNYVELKFTANAVPCHKVCTNNGTTVQSRCLLTDHSSTLKFHKYLSQSCLCVSPITAIQAANLVDFTTVHSTLPLQQPLARRVHKCGIQAYSDPV